MPAQSVEDAFFFKSHYGDNLYGVSHIPANRGRVGVLFCHPLGDEKQASYRTHVTLSRHLAKADIANFRFDCVGFGDSDGESADATVASLLRDIDTAIDVFVKKSGVDSVVLAGVRFGATLASLAADRNARVSGLALISPVLNGQEFWHQLIKRQQIQMVVRGEKAPTIESVKLELEQNGRFELEGDLFSAEMVQQVEAIRITEKPSRFSGFVAICQSSDQSIASAVSYFEKAGCSTTVWHPIEKPFWSGKTLYYPADQNALATNFVELVSDVEANRGQSKCQGKLSA